MTRSDILAEWNACHLLLQADRDRLTSAGIPLMALAGNADGHGFCIMRDRVVPHAAAHRFEFARHDATAGEGVPALIALALGRDGAPFDLVGFHGGPAPFIGSWLGRCRFARRGEPRPRARRPDDSPRRIVLAPCGAPRGCGGRSGSCCLDAAERRHDGGRHPRRTPPPARPHGGPVAARAGSDRRTERRSVNAAPEAGALVDAGTVRVFVKTIHDAAARALKGAPDPGVLQLVASSLPAASTWSRRASRSGPWTPWRSSAISAASKAG